MEKITFNDVRNLIIEINPIINFPSIRHGFITADTCKKYNMAVMYNKTNLPNAYDIDFMDIDAIQNKGKTKGVTITIPINVANKDPIMFIIEGLIFHEDGNDIEKVCSYSLTDNIMEKDPKDIYGFYSKWKSFIKELLEEFK